MKHLLKSFALLGAIAMLFGTALCAVSCSAEGDTTPPFNKAAALEKAAGTFTIGGEDYELAKNGKVKDSSGAEVGSFSVGSDGTVTIKDKAGETLYTAKTDKDGKIDTGSVKDKNGEMVTVEKKPEASSGGGAGATTDGTASITIKTTEADLNNPPSDGKVAVTNDSFTVVNCTVAQDKLGGTVKDSGNWKNWYVYGGKAYAKTNNDAFYMTITLAEGYKFVEGSVLKFDIAATGSDVKAAYIKIKGENAFSLNDAGIAKDSSGTYEYKLKASDIESDGTVKITKAGTWGFHSLEMSGLEKAAAGGNGGGNGGGGGGTSDPVAVTGVTLDKSIASIGLNETVQLKATVAPAAATNTEVTWSSSADSIATVSQTGLVTGKSAGSATITVTTADGSKTATCAVTVSGETVYTAKYFAAAAGAKPSSAAATATVDTDGASLVTMGDITWSYVSGGPFSDAASDAQKASTGSNADWTKARYGTADGSKRKVGGIQLTSAERKDGTLITEEGDDKGKFKLANADDLLAEASFKVTAKSAVKLTKIAADLVTGSVSSVKAKLKVGDAAAVDVGSGKDMSFADIAVNKTLAVNDEVTITIQVLASKDIISTKGGIKEDGTAADAFSMSLILGNIELCFAENK